ncbi:hypothetical protein ATK36_0744 [Amycolatopsis sulphurea]|uniref:Uncharacterized protein n=1 Tax=Amycolatopsis sulphurea TaxID=76022 RepID=A0A2A9G2Z8_9PSEU|nr:hypothetical protein ATK36_0744 [Amycolatopsis sulphurea]
MLAMPGCRAKRLPGTSPGVSNRVIGFGKPPSGSGAMKQA